jgi:hypothetical protein
MPELSQMTPQMIHHSVGRLLCGIASKNLTRIFDTKTILIMNLLIGILLITTLLIMT